MPPKRGSKAHKGRNITGLRNQRPQANEERPALPPTPPPHDPAPALLDLDDLESDDEGWESDAKYTDLGRHFGTNDTEDSESDEELQEFDWKDFDPDLDDAHLQHRLLKYAIAMGDDPRDEDWVPPEEVRKELKRKRRQKGV